MNSVARSTAPAPGAALAAAAPEVSLFRLYLLRALYLLLVVGAGGLSGSSIFDGGQHWEFMEGVETCMLASFALLSILGLRYPLQMLPVLLWELLWKTLWLGIVPLPQWWAGHLDASLMPNVIAISLVVLVYIAIPWRYVYVHYVQARGDRWH
jgi:hypothetical protein